MKRLLYPLMTCLLLASCVEEYKLPKNIADFYRQEILIEGRILSGTESVFYVTKTIPLNDNSRMTEYVLDADIHIIGQNGFRSEQAICGEDSAYTINAGELPSNTLYAVEVEVDGEIYQSIFQPILQTPEIDEVTWEEYEEGMKVKVSTHNDEGSTRCYMWTYEEDWDFHAALDLYGTPGMLFSPRLYPKEPDEFNPYYYCWGHSHSTSINIYNTEDLTENRVTDLELFRRELNDIRISYIYSLLVKQFCLSIDAYEYFRLMKLYTEESDGLFTPMPSDVRGNMVCISNPEKTVRGQVIASNVTEKRIFVYASDFKMNTPDPERCTYQLPSENSMGWVMSWRNLIDYSGYAAQSSGGNLDKSSVLYSPLCVNCLLEKKASKKRPDFWPNNHE